MSFEPEQYDGSDPLSAPCLSFAKGIYPRWQAPKRYRDAGYAFTSKKLPGKKGDGRDLERAAICQELTRDGYEYWLKIWDEGVGAEKLSNCNYETLRLWQRSMKENGRTQSHIKRMFTGLRIITRYGCLINNEEAKRVSGILSAMRIKMPPARTIFATRDQVMAVVAEADKLKMHSFAVGVLLQFELNLRPVDVRGQWLTIGSNDSQSGITRNGKRWADGLTWDMFNADCTELTKVISKTASSMPDPITFDLAPLTDIRDRLMKLRETRQTGPVIVTDRHGLPYDRHAWSGLWRKLCRASGVPDEVRNVDTRAGGISEAQSLGVEGITLRDSAQHSQASTTNRYARNRSENANKVIQMRAEKK